MRLPRPQVPVVPVRNRDSINSLIKKNPKLNAMECSFKQGYDIFVFMRKKLFARKNERKDLTERAFQEETPNGVMVINLMPNKV